MFIIRAVGSLRFAITLLAGLILILSTSTIMEALYGTPFAQENFYTTYWFDFFLGLVWLNIFCATWTRFPFKKRHIGFVITHIGILTLLIGALLSSVYGAEGQMSLFEGQSNHFITQQNLVLTSRIDKLTTKSFKLNTRHTEREFALDLDDKNNLKLQVLKFYPNAILSRVLTDNPKNTPNHAIKVHIQSERVGADQSFWLIEHDADNPDSSVAQLGPATFRLKNKNSSQDTMLKIKQNKTGKSWEINLNQIDLHKTIPLDNSGLHLANIRYLPQAAVIEKQLVNAPDSVKFNPAVTLQIHDTQGQVEEHTRFMLFPTFGSLRGGEKNNLFNLEISLETPLPEGFEDLDPAPSVTFFYDKNNHWSCRINSSKNPNAPAIDLKKGQKIQPGWMDMTLTIEELYSNASIAYDAKQNKNSAEPNPALWVCLKDSASPAWIFPNKPATLTAGTSKVTLSIGPGNHALPFTLTLKDFRKIDYPGTNNPAAFESDVLLTDETSGIRMEKTISMNKPLDYKGWRIFQASYMQDEEHGEGSVFTIAKNPGILLIYGGAPIILLGVIILFYLHPFFNRSLSDK